MFAFELQLHGRVLCTAGLADLGVLTSMVTRVARADGTESTELTVGGLNSATNEYLDWCKEDVGLGDVITLRILDTPTPDPPSVRRQDPQLEERERRRYYEKLKREYEGE